MSVQTPFITTLSFTDIAEAEKVYGQLEANDKVEFCSISSAEGRIIITFEASENVVATSETTSKPSDKVTRGKNPQPLAHNTKVEQGIFVQRALVDGSWKVVKLLGTVKTTKFYTRPDGSKIYSETVTYA